MVWRISEIRQQVVGQMSYIKVRSHFSQDISFLRLPGAFWGPRGPKKGVFGILGVGGGGDPPAWPSRVG